MRKRASIVPGDSVEWIVKVHPQLDFEGFINAKVKALTDEMAALIEVPQNWG